MARITRSTQNTARISRGRPRTAEGSKARLASIAEAIQEATHKPLNATDTSPTLGDSQLPQGDQGKAGIPKEGDGSAATNVDPHSGQAPQQPMKATMVGEGDQSTADLGDGFRIDPYAAARAIAAEQLLHEGLTLTNVRGGSTQPAAGGIGQPSQQQRALAHAAKGSAGQSPSRSLIYDINNTARRATPETASRGIAQLVCNEEEALEIAHDDSGCEGLYADLPTTPRLRPQPDLASPTMSDILALTKSTPADTAVLGMSRDTPAPGPEGKRWVTYARTGQRTLSPVAPAQNAARYAPNLSPIPEFPTPRQQQPLDPIFAGAGGSPPALPPLGSGTTLLINEKGEYMYRVQIATTPAADLRRTGDSFQRGLELGECFEREDYNSQIADREDGTTCQGQSNHEEPYVDTTSRLQTTIASGSGSRIAQSTSGATPRSMASIHTSGAVENLKFINRFRQASSSSPAGGPISLFMSQPPEGTDLPVEVQPAQLFSAQHPSQVGDWEEVRDDAKLVIRVAGHGPLDGQFNPADLTMSGRVAKCLNLFLHTDKTQICLPIAEFPPVRPNTDPLSMLALGLTPEQAQRAVRQMFISCRDITLIVHPFGWRWPGFHGTLVGFTTSDANIVYKITRRELLNMKVVKAMVQILTDNPRVLHGQPARTAYEQSLDTLAISFLDVRGPGGVPTPVFRFHLELLADDIASFSAMRNVLHSIDWRDSFYGPGRLITPTGSTCGICHGSDHPRGLCPYPDLPGWMGPLRTPEAPPAPATEAGATAAYKGKGKRRATNGSGYEERKKFARGE